MLRNLGHDVILLGDGRSFLERVLADPPDFVFNYAEGEGIGRAREARVPAVLEMLGIPYSGSDPLTLATTLDKDCAKRLAASAGVAVPHSILVSRESHPSGLQSADCAGLYFPVLVKPVWEGSSKGIRNKCLVHSPDELPQTVAWLLEEQRQPVLVEEFIQGDEVTVGIMGNSPPEIFGMMRIVPVTPTEHFVYSLEIKRDFRRLVRYECPAPLPESTLDALREAALRSYRALGCLDVSRVDFRIRGGVPYFIEVNPIPGLHPRDSDLVIMADILKWDYDRLVETILNIALQRVKLPATDKQRDSAPAGLVHAR